MCFKKLMVLGECWRHVLDEGLWFRRTCDISGVSNQKVGECRVVVDQCILFLHLARCRALSSDVLEQKLQASLHCVCSVPECIHQNPILIMSDEVWNADNPCRFLDPKVQHFLADPDEKVHDAGWHAALLEEVVSMLELVVPVWDSW